MERGICYVAWGEHSLNEAARSAWWNAQPGSPQLPTCLITDEVTHVPDGIFGQVIRTDFAPYQNLHHFYRKMACIRLTPFDVTCYLDADTYPIGDLSLGFRLATRHQFAVAISPGQAFVWRDAEYVHYNGGALWFSGRPLVWANKVIDLAAESPECDEPAWSIAWDQLGVNPAVLPGVFNLVAAGPIHDRTIRVWHSRWPLRKTLKADYDCYSTTE